MKNLVKELAKKYHKIDDAFLSLFEKKPVIFIEDGTDLKGEIASNQNQFEKSYAISDVKSRSVSQIKPSQEITNDGRSFA